METAPSFVSDNIEASHESFFESPGAEEFLLIERIENVLIIARNNYRDISSDELADHGDEAFRRSIDRNRVRTALVRRGNPGVHRMTVTIFELGLDDRHAFIGDFEDKPVRVRVAARRSNEHLVVSVGDFDFSLVDQLRTVITRTNTPSPSEQMSVMHFVLAQGINERALQADGPRRKVSRVRFDHISNFKEPVVGFLRSFGSVAGLLIAADVFVSVGAGVSACTECLGEFAGEFVFVRGFELGVAADFDLIRSVVRVVDCAVNVERAGRHAFEVVAAVNPFDRIDSLVGKFDFSLLEIYFSAGASDAAGFEDCAVDVDGGFGFDFVDGAVFGGSGVRSRHSVSLYYPLELHTLKSFVPYRWGEMVRRHTQFPRRAAITAEL